MDRESYQRAKELFHQVAELEEPARREALDAGCAGREDLRRLVEELLQAQVRPTRSLLDEPAVAAVFREALADASPEALIEPIPSRIGPYRVIRRLGVGGMGVVYEAEQDSPRRAIAVKVIRPALASRALVRRFEREAQILGQLQHPGIAQIYEAGAAVVEGEGGSRAPQPYLAMELIRGEPLSRFAQSHGLDAPDKLALVIRLCDAVQYAHQKGVVHRDLKPSNILVVDDREQGIGNREQGARHSPLTPHHSRDRQNACPGQTKILDFGVARLVGEEFQMLTVATDVGELIGTLSYMSPEQVAGDPRLVDTRADIYSLGVILFELLAGRLPLEPGTRSLIEAARVIQEEEPPSLGAIDARLRGDVSNIVRKALEKHPDCRYQTSADLSADILRYLNHEPILARPPTTFYVLKKFARRHRGLVAGALATCVALMAGIAGIGWFAWKAYRARLEADTNRVVAEDNAALAQRNEQRASASEQSALREAYRATTSAAVLALDKHDVVAADRCLQAAPAALRNWEWKHLVSRLDESLASVLVGEPDVIGACYDQSGSEIYVPLNSGRVLRLNASSFEKLGDADPALLPCLLGRDCGPLHREDTRVRAWLTILDDHLALCDPRTLELRRHDVRDWGMTGALNSGAIGQPVYAADGRSFVFCVCDDTIDPQTTWFVERDTGRSVRIPTDSDECRFHKLAISPEGGLVALALTKPLISVFETQSGRRVHELTGHTDRIEFMTFSATGKELLSASRDGTLRRWDLEKGEASATGWGHTDYVNMVAYSPDGARIASASRDRTVRLWDASTLRPIAAYHGSREDVISVCFSRDGDTLLTAARDGWVHVWDAMATGPAGVLTGHASYVYPVVFSPDGLVIASGGWDRTARLWEARTGRPLAALSGPESEIMSLAYAADGSRLLASDASHTLTEWDLTKPTAPRRAFSEYHAFRGPISYLWDMGLVPPRGPGDSERSAFHAASREPWAGEMLSGGERFTGAIIVSSPHGEVALRFRARDVLRHLASVTAFQRETGTILWQRHDLTAHHAASDPTGVRVAVPTTGDVVRILDTFTGEEFAAIHGHAAEVLAVAWSPDGSRLATGGRDKIIRLWDPRYFDDVAQLPGHTSYVWSLAFSPDGSMLASGGGDHTVRIWDTRPLRGRLRPMDAVGNQ